MSEMKKLIRYATMAPSGHNTQPWKFCISENTICIRPDLSRRLSVVDPDDRELYISLGAAIENLMIAAEHKGYSTSAEYSSDYSSVCVKLDASDFKKDNDTLLNAIPERQSTRSNYDGRPIPEADIKKLESFPLEQGVSAVFITEPEKMDRIAELVREGNSIQINNPDFIRELVSWVRFNEKEVNKYRDGLSFKSMQSPPSPRFIGKLIMKFFLKPDSQSEKDEEHIKSSSALMVVLSESNDFASWIRTGRSFERLALCATSLGIKNAHLNQPCEVPELKEELQKILGVGERHPQLLLRLGYAEKLPGSVRRDLGEVVE